MRLKIGDTVIVTAGNYKGTEGKIKSIKGDLAIVSGVNMKKKHQKAGQDGKGGKIISFEGPINISNIRYVADGSPVKLRARMSENGKKEIYYITKQKEEKVVRTV